MNIFVLDENPVIAAKMACDKHIVKMILESAQMLCTAKRVQDGESCIWRRQRMVETLKDGDYQMLITKRLSTKQVG